MSPISREVFNTDDTEIQVDLANEITRAGEKDRAKIDKQQKSGYLAAFLLFVIESADFYAR